MATDTTIARTILNQLGGQHFIAMTGAKELTACNDSLRFRIGRNMSKANFIEIKLNASDTYTMRFYNKPRANSEYRVFANCAAKGLSYEETIERLKRCAEPKLLQEYKGVYCDQLQDVFTGFTGMATSLF